MSNQNNNINDIGNRIQNSVNEALQTGEFGKLNSEIRDSVRTVLNGVGDQINGAVSSAINSVHSESFVSRTNDMYKNYNGPKPTVNDRGFVENYTKGRGYDTSSRELAKHREERAALVKSPKPLIKFEEVGAISGYFGVFGGIFATITGIGIIISMFGMPLFLIGGGVAALVGGACIGKGVNNVHWLNLAKKYKKMASEKMYVGVDTIANATGTSQKKVVRNIKKILAKGFFPEGYIDDENTTLMVSKSIYDQYIEAKNGRLQMLLEDEEDDGISASDENELNSMVSKGMRYIERLHELNDIIPGESISEQLSRSEDILNEIFDRVKEHPDQMDNCHKLMEYYLPTMIKLVEAYAEYDKMSAPGEEVISAKAEIENTLNVINQAFVELINKLYRDSVWDVKSDAKVLQTMLKQEGLAADDMVDRSNERENQPALQERL